MSASHPLLAVTTGIAICAVAVAVAPRAAAGPAAEDLAWRPVELRRASGAVTALDAVSDDDVWIATIRSLAGTAIDRRHFGPWEEQVHYASRGIDDIVMLSADEGWFVGYDWSMDELLFRPLVVHYHAGAFDDRVVRPEGWLFGVDAVAPDAVWAVGGQATGPDGAFTAGMVLRRQDDVWRTEATIDGQALVDIDMVSADEGWAVGTRGALLHYAEGRWTPVDLPAGASGLSLAGVQMLSAVDGWAVGDAGRLLRRRGGAWEVLATGLEGALRHVRPLSSTDAWAVGSVGDGPSAGVIARQRGGTWEAVTPPAGTGALYGLDMLGPDLGWAGGVVVTDTFHADGLLLRYGPPLPTPTPTATREGIQVYEGLYGSAFEVSSFVTGTLRCPGYGQGWWLEGNDTFWKRYESIYPDAGGFDTGTLMVHTRFRGVLSPEGNHGHLGGYRHMVEVIELLDMVKVDRCPLPNFTPPAPTTPTATQTGAPPTGAPPTFRLYLPRAMRGAGEG